MGMEERGSPSPEMMRNRLRAHDIRPTGVRLAVLDALLKQAHSLSQYEIEAAVGVHFNRSSIYRTLQLFEESGVVHRVPHTDSVVKYAACETSCSHDGHVHQHAHFQCASCSNTYCLTDVDMPALNTQHLPGRVQEIEVLFNGTCEKCLATEAKAVEPAEVTA